VVLRRVGAKTRKGARSAHVDHSKQEATLLPQLVRRRDVGMCCEKEYIGTYIE